MSDSGESVPVSDNGNSVNSGDSLFSEQIAAAPVVDSTTAGSNPDGSVLDESNLGAPGSSTSGVSDETVGKTMITIRSLVTSKEAGAIIGKNGKNVADLRDETGVKAGVSKPVRGVHDRVLTITGTLEGVARAYSMAGQTLVDNPPTLPYVHSLSPPAPPGVTTVRLLIPHQQMGSVIGRQGLKIKSIQENSRVRMVASKEMLPQSTERVVEIQGTPESLKTAIWEVGKCLLDDWERAAGSILYVPQLRPRGEGPLDISLSAVSGRHPNSTGGAGFASSNNGGGFNGSAGRFNRGGFPGPGNHLVAGNGPEDEHDFTDQEITIPADMVGCIIGKGGAKIQEIRRESGAKISIAKQAIDESGERLFTIRGTPQANERALFLLYEQLEQEKLRRSEEN
ncbi:Pbp2p [Sugiyamaella lignohabitans]|uniref:Pbp2p n=1 Tax=Sugiyamaella lignohabitans TaxID=796027 RepID=A0A161HLH2_9ASCO|nr:Pbp2p [Sugiyamaella lignohabitans]ANB12928.1 Pbp2p [Sugiyamaella lignohabitans]